MFWKNHNPLDDIPSPGQLLHYYNQLPFMELQEFTSLVSHMESADQKENRLQKVEDQKHIMDEYALKYERWLAAAQPPPRFSKSFVPENPAVEGKFSETLVSLSSLAVADNQYRRVCPEGEEK